MSVHQEVASSARVPDRGGRRAGADAQRAAADAVEGSFARLARGEVDNPPRVRLAIPDGQFAVMPCVDRGLGLAGLKTFAWTPGGTPFLVVLMTIDEPEIVAVLEADTLGQLRTAAASAVAAKHLARAGAASLGVIGCGRQAASHVAALRDAAAVARACRRLLPRRRQARRVLSRARLRAGPLAAGRGRAVTSSSPRRPRSRPCCRASGCATARSCSPSARTTRTRASSTTRCSSARPRSTSTRVSRRARRRAT